MQETTFNKYGVKFPLQNKDISEKSLIKSFYTKDYVFPSNNIIKYQGYENFALNDLIKQNVQENDIITSRKLVPTIWYNINENKHRHFVDIFIPSKNLCIEVKSEWTLKFKNDVIFLKQLAGKELGYNYEIWVYDNKGNLLNKYE